MLRGAIASLPQNLRVAVLATGPFSLEIHGPEANHGEDHGSRDMQCASECVRGIKNADMHASVAEATTETMCKPGNVGGELLNWITMLGAVGATKPSYLFFFKQKTAYEIGQ